jgi:hypothetical protein
MLQIMTSIHGVEETNALFKSKTKFTKLRTIQAQREMKLQKKFQMPASLNKSVISKKDAL